MHRILIATCIASSVIMIAASSIAAPLQTFPISRGQMQKWCGGTADGVVTGGGNSGCDVCANDHCVDLDCNNKIGKCKGTVVAGPPANGRRYPVYVNDINPMIAAIKRESKRRY
jgi:hypothetical protein